MKLGDFCISFDFELYWGFVGERSLESYQQNLLGVHQAIPRLLELFERYDIHATWATVGFLMCDGLEELRSFVPELRPGYVNKAVSSYEYIGNREVQKRLIKDDAFRKCHFAPELVRQILATPGQELGTHTFSHYYCLEQGQTAAEFRADMHAARQLAQRKYNVEMKSVIFPRHQTNEEYLKICFDEGIRIYRGNQNSRIYEAIDVVPLTVRAQKLLDSYVPLTGNNTGPAVTETSGLVNVRASAFLRPYSRKLAGLQLLKLNRIKQSMRAAAQQGEIFHLWWHPHNFGADTGLNISFLKEILEYYLKLKDGYGMRSRNMNEIAGALRKNL